MWFWAFRPEEKNSQPDRKKHCANDEYQRASGVRHPRDPTREEDLKGVNEAADGGDNNSDFVANRHEQSFGQADSPAWEGG